MYKQAMRRMTAFMLLALLNISVFAHAGGDNPVLKSAVVKHVGTQQEKLAFQVQLDNESGEKFSLTIRDEAGNALFQNVFTDKKFDKKFLIEKGENTKLSFIIRSLRDNQTQTFEASTVTRYVEDYVVSNK
jgi:hypothetical protein